MYVTENKYQRVAEIISSADGISNGTELIRQVRGNNKVTIREDKHVGWDLIPTGKDFIPNSRLTCHDKFETERKSMAMRRVIRRVERKKIARVQDRDR